MGRGKAPHGAVRIANGIARLVESPRKTQEVQE